MPQEHTGERHRSRMEPWELDPSVPRPHETIGRDSCLTWESVFPDQQQQHYQAHNEFWAENPEGECEGQ